MIEQARISVFAQAESDQLLAKHYATHLSLPLVDALTGHSRFILVIDGDCIKLFDTSHAPPMSITITFTAGKTAHRKQFGGGKKQPLGRALGLHKFPNPHVVDATAGLGSDAFVMACLGCRVTMIEKSPILTVLLENALHRASAVDDFKAIIQQMSLLTGDARTTLKTLALDCPPEIVYLDPMFPKRRKSALVKKEMQILQVLLDPPNDEEELLAAALATASERVVVKRPGNAPALTGPPSTMSISSPNIRYDVYVKKAGAINPESSDTAVADQSLNL